MVAAYQLVNVRVKGQIDNQACDNVLWYYCAHPAGAALATFADCVRRLWQREIMPLLTEYYEVYQVEAWALAGVRNIIGGTDASPTLKSTRAIWGERYVNANPIVGGIGNAAGAPSPSFNAFSVEKVVGQTATIGPTTGGGITFDNAMIKGGGMRIGGMHEEVTVDTEANRIAPSVFNAMSTAVRKLRFMSVLDVLPDSPDSVKFLSMAVVSTTELGASRQDKSASATDPRLWVPKWQVGAVTSMAVSQFVSSQVSRKRKPRKFQ